MAHAKDNPLAHPVVTVLYYITFTTLFRKQIKNKKNPKKNHILCLNKRKREMLMII